MLTAVVPRLAALVAQRGVQAIAAGLLSGAVVGAAGVASGLIPVGAQRVTAALAVLSCPGSGQSLTKISSGQPLLVIARSKDGLWLEVYIGSPGITRGWVPAARLRLQANGDGLPVAGCAAPATVGPPPTFVPSPTPVPTPAPGATVVATVTPTAGPTLAPGATPTPTPKPTATPKATATPNPTPPPTPTPAPTPTPPDTPPTVTVVSASPTSIGCGQASVIHAKASDTDTDGITAVRMWYRLGSGTIYGPISFTYHHSILFSQDYWYGSITDPGWGVSSLTQVTYWLEATDTRASTSDPTLPGAAYYVYYSCTQ